MITLAARPPSFENDHCLWACWHDNLICSLSRFDCLLYFDVGLAFPTMFSKYYPTSKIEIQVKLMEASHISSTQTFEKWPVSFWIELRLRELIM